MVNFVQNMKQLEIIGLLMLLLAGCTEYNLPESWFTRSETTIQHHPPFPGSSLHPLAYLRKPEPNPLNKVPPILPSYGWDHYSPTQIRKEYMAISPTPALPASWYIPQSTVNPETQVTIRFTDSLPFQSEITLSQECYLFIQLDNDIFNYTDRFYTNGIRIDFISPIFNYNPINFLMIPYWNKSINYYGIRGVQNIYTPSTTLSDSIKPGDRPYAGYLFLGSFKISNDPLKKVRFTRELQLGVIGPSSLGGALQISFHSSTPQNHKPIGWEYQIQDDFLLNYRVSLEKGIVSTKAFEVNMQTEGILGTVYTYLQGGFYIRTGRFNPYFSELFFSKRSVNKKRNAKNIQAYIFFNTNGRLWAYNATLEGGMFNKNSPYTIPSSQINRLIFEGSAGIAFSYGGFELRGEQFLLSPEFQNGWWHKWLSIRLSFSF
jgi:lipid A 3-O-deacylase